MAGQRRFVPVVSAIALFALAGCGGGGSDATAEASATEDPASSSAPAPVEMTSEPEPTVTESVRADGIRVGPAKGIILASPMVEGGVQVGALDPASGDTWLISEFGVGTDQSKEFRDWPIELQDDFTRDFTRMAHQPVDQMKMSTGALGWYEDGGEFVDVTTSLPKDTGDFGKQIRYFAGWFDEEGNFHFGSAEHNAGSTPQIVQQRYMVPAGGGPEDVQDMGAPPEQPDEGCKVTVEGTLSIDDPWCTRIRADATGSSGPVSDWISDTEYIEISDDVIYRDVTHDEVAYREELPQQITPDIDRTVYSAVVSPDKTQVAFISPDEEESKRTGLPPTVFEVFVVPADGSAPPEQIGTLGFGGAADARIVDWL